MATGLELKNKGVCGEGNNAGFNISKGCAPLLKDISEIRVTPYDFQYDDTREFNDEYLKELQLTGKLQILKRIDLFESQSSDNQYSASSKGFESLAIAGIYKWRATFNHDVWFNKQMGSLEGEYHKRVEFVDSRGTIFRTEGKTSDTSRGFAVAHITRGMQTFLAGTTKQAQYLDLQFAEKAEFDDRPVVIDASLLDTATIDVEPIVQANVSFVAIPSSGDTTIEVSAVIDRGNKGFITGATTSGDFKVTIDGVVQPAGVATQGANTYTIPTTALVASSVVTASFNNVIEVVGDSLYISNTDSKTVV